MAEFKRLSEVEVVAEPAESANVLIEENGVIKKAPKNEFGSKEEWDAIINIDYDSENGTETRKLISGSYADIKAKIESGIIPAVFIKRVAVYAEVTYITFSKLVSSDLCIYADSEYIYLNFGNNGVSINTDNTLS